MKRRVFEFARGVVVIAFDAIGLSVWFWKTRPT